MQFEFNYNPKTGITFLFSDIDDVVDPIIKQLDHGLLIHNNDPLLKYLNDFMKTEKTSLKLTIMEDVTSAENLCKFIYNKVSEHLPIKKITLQETTSSIVTYEISN